MVLLQFIKNIYTVPRSIRSISHCVWVFLCVSVCVFACVADGVAMTVAVAFFNVEKIFNFSDV